MQKTIIFVMTIGVAPPTVAQTPPAQVPVAEQQNRDAEKIKILNAELAEQKQLLADAQKTRAVHLADNNAEAVAKTENRLEELNANIKQLQQEIALADGSVNKNLVVTSVTQPVGNVPTNPQKTSTTGPWWDLYNKPAQAAQ